MYIEVKDPEGYVIETFAVNPAEINKTMRQVRKIYPPKEKFKLTLISDD